MKNRAAVISIVALFLLGGCSLPSGHRISSIIVSDGCLVIVQGLTAAQAEKLSENWNISDDCEIEVIKAHK